MIEIGEIWELAEANAQVVADAANEFVAPRPIIEPDKRWLWLTFPNCGLATEVLRQQFKARGIDCHGVINRGLEGTRFLDHALLEVEGEEPIYVDPTYLQFFSEFGVDASLVNDAWDLNAGEVLPSDKTLVYTKDQLGDLTDWLAGETMFLLNKWQHGPVWQARYSEGRPFGDTQIDSTLERGEVEDFYRCIYDPKFFEPYGQNADNEAAVADYLKDYQPCRLSLSALARHFGVQFQMAE